MVGVGFWEILKLCCFYYYVFFSIFFYCIIFFENICINRSMEIRLWFEEEVELEKILGLEIIINNIF